MDLWHAKEYLMELSKSLFGEGTEACKTWTDERCHQLKHAGGAAVLQTLETLAESADEVRVRPSAKEQLHATLTYYRSHHLRGLSAVPCRGLADWIRAGGECVQDGGGESVEGRRHALERC